MGQLKNFYTSNHQSTSRKYLERMQDEKVHCMEIAKQYEDKYWDGDRRYGYGGYKYDGRWAPVAQKIIDTYSLTNNSRILDVGCGKAHVLYEIKKNLPDAEVVGFDISEHGIKTAPEEIRPHLLIARAQERYQWEDNYFDFAMSAGCFHNLKIFELENALHEFERVSKQSYIMLESYRNNQELFNLQCWALTCESFFEKSEWLWLYDKFGYTGDYEFIYFE